MYNGGKIRSHQMTCPVRGAFRSVDFDSHARTGIHKIRKTISSHSHNQWHLSQTTFQMFNKPLEVSQLVSQPWRPARPLPQAVPARQTLGIYLDIVLDPQPLRPMSPMARGLLTTTGTQDEDLIPFPARRMNMHEVPFCLDFHVNNTMLVCLLGSRSSGQRPTHPSASLPEYIAKQVSC